MCLAIPGKIVSINGNHALVDFDGVQKKVIISLLPRAEVGKYVIVHAGAAIEEVDEKQAYESIALWRQLGASGAIDKADYV